MRYCASCITPETRPHIRFNEKGVCNACLSHATKKEIDWKHRQRAFLKVVGRAQSHSSGYDCVIPVSGGKDSTWQVVKCLEYGLNPLAVTWKTPARTAVGTQNLENLVNLGVDHIDFQVSPKVEKKFMLQSLVRYGSTAIPMHMAIYHIPVRVALNYNIPLVVWGENGAFEYGSEEDEGKGFVMDNAWLKKFGAAQGLTIRDFVSGTLTEKELTPYQGFTDEEVKSKGLYSIFLGYYFEWDPEWAFRAARKHGFQASPDGARTGYYNFADIDDDFISLHHYLKWYKFGFTRLFDNLSLEIRNGRMSRDEAIRIVRETGDQTPHEDIDKFSAFVSITRNRFFQIAEGFRNQKIWTRQNGAWKIEGFLIPDWKWQ